MRLALSALPLLDRLRITAASVLDHMGFGLAVVLGLVLATWLCAALGLPSPLAPFEELLIL